jgi:tight adherence protein C
MAADDMLPVLVFVGIVAGTFWILGLISKRNSLAEDRLERIGRPKSLVEIEMGLDRSRERFGEIKDAMGKLGGVMEPQSELERNTLRVTLANAGFRSESAPSVYQGLRFVSLLAFGIPAVLWLLLGSSMSTMAVCKACMLAGVGFYLPQITLGFLKSQRQKEIFLTLPDALDLLVVCVESGLGLDAGLRKVTDEMKGPPPAGSAA